MSSSNSGKKINSKFEKLKNQFLNNDKKFKIASTFSKEIATSKQINTLTPTKRLNSILEPGKNLSILSGIPDPSLDTKKPKTSLFDKPDFNKKISGSFHDYLNNHLKNNEAVSSINKSVFFHPIPELNISAKDTNSENQVAQFEYSSSILSNTKSILSNRLNDSDHNSIALNCPQIETTTSNINTIVTFPKTTNGEFSDNSINNKIISSDILLPNTSNKIINQFPCAPENDPNSEILEFNNIKIGTPVNTDFSEAHSDYVSFSQDELFGVFSSNSQFQESDNHDFLTTHQVSSPSPSLNSDAAYNDLNSDYENYFLQVITKFS
ncbi:hypothetical protein AYI70_g3342 [Smittium culicis]|uniref:Uncharacterized protein n=1 Tax=Smittium culicis TaxID=133412 RepID=A0A1R1Y3U0_9FUNG|nr:hypothetical protein AYI70_g11368 [Smittium culicis]OMJ21647.1 hypothetical protein AYI70_g3342 [Smittium culicis]